MRTVAVTVCLCLSSVRLAAQAPVPALRAGARVRVTYTIGARTDTWGQYTLDALHTTGRLQHLSADSVVVAQSGGESVVVPWSTVLGLDSARSCSKVGKGMGWGAGIGVLVGGVTGGVILAGMDEGGDDGAAGVAIGAAGGVVLGGVIGAVIGGVSAGTCWDRVAP